MLLELSGNMLVYIGKYKDSRKVLNKVIKLFLSEPLLEKFEKFTHKLLRKNKPFLFNTFFVHKKVSQPTVFVKVDSHDTWSADWTLSNIIVPLLVELKKVKTGVPMVDLNDIPEDLRVDLSGLSEDSDEFYAALEKHWNWVVDEMIWAMTQIQTNEDDSPFNTFWKEKEKDNISDEEAGDLFAIMSYVGRSPELPDLEKQYTARIVRGTTLFGKYFRNLWT